ncbi:Unknown protein [Striga hermonthica]|uniref:Uncharacterized protein n=1 Tax=Striga hermonthica TaxID=68872 RepID=A0A9N7N2A2_STRHE|nr:Unknown protein [Striga hermonthica]
MHRHDVVGYLAPIISLRFSGLRKHPADATSGAGVCASCLRERLSAFAVAQAQAQRDRRRPDAEPDVPFPRSVSPYLSRRKSDTSAAVCRTHGRRQRFHSASQVGADEERKSKRVGFTSLLFGIFRSKSERTGPVPGVAPICDPIVPIDSSCSVPSPSWFSADFFTGRRDKNVGTSSIDGNNGGSRPRRTRGNRGRGMSPARHSGNEDRVGSSGYSSESSQGRTQTAGRTPAQVQRSGGRAAAARCKGVSGLKFCLSPLVRASPSRYRSQKRLPPEIVVAGESRVPVPVRPHLSATTSFYKNRSRKLADFGRYNYGPTH